LDAYVVVLGVMVDADGRQVQETRMSEAQVYDPLAIVRRTCTNLMAAWKLQHDTIVSLKHECHGMGLH
jgi:hypothetical protein